MFEPRPRQLFRLEFRYLHFADIRLQLPGKFHHHMGLLLFAELILGQPARTQSHPKNLPHSRPEEELGQLVLGQLGLEH